MRKIEKYMELPKRVLAFCKNRDNSFHWTESAAYLHLEVSELIEAIRGKGKSTPEEEAGDVLLVLMSITEYHNIPWENVLKQVELKLIELDERKA